MRHSDYLTDVTTKNPLNGDFDGKKHGKESINVIFELAMFDYWEGTYLTHIPICGWLNQLSPSSSPLKNNECLVNGGFP